jgi:hypothetical protein
MVNGRLRTRNQSLTISRYTLEQLLLLLLLLLLSASNKDCCSVCKKPFHGKQKCIKCSGPCGSRFHLSCLKMRDTEYLFLIVEGQYTYSCVSCVVANRDSSAKNASRSLRFASISELPVKDISPDGELILSDLSHSAFRSRWCGTMELAHISLLIILFRWF